MVRPDQQLPVQALNGAPGTTREAVLTGAALTDDHAVRAAAEAVPMSLVDLSIFEVTDAVSKTASTKATVQGLAGHG